MRSILHPVSPDAHHEPAGTVSAFSKSVYEARTSWSRRYLHC